MSDTQACPASRSSRLAKGIGHLCQSDSGQTEARGSGKGDQSKQYIEQDNYMYVCVYIYTYECMYVCVYKVVLVVFSNADFDGFGGRMHVHVPPVTRVKHCQICPILKPRLLADGQYFDDAPRGYVQVAGLGLAAFEFEKQRRLT